MKKIKVLLLAVALFLTGCNCTIRKTPSEWATQIAVEKFEEKDFRLHEWGIYTTNAELVLKVSSITRRGITTFAYTVEIHYIEILETDTDERYFYNVMIAFQNRYGNDVWGKLDYKDTQIVDYAVVEKDND